MCKKAPFTRWCFFKTPFTLFLKAAISICIIAIPIYGQEREQRQELEYKILFWNLENFFDTFYDIGREEGNFTPFGEMHWTKKRFTTKRNAIAKTIIGAGEGSAPVIIGFAEVEKRYVLTNLIEETPLAQIGYSIIHKDSPDRRGIDVALIYRRELFSPLETEFIRVTLPDTTATTRDILYTKGVLDRRDTLHIFINHWPSKFGGANFSEPGRKAASNALKRKCDSILHRNESANIIAMGDFNDTPDAATITALDNLINLSYSLHKRGEGSIKYRGAWEVIDQMLISRNLLKREVSMSVYSPQYLLEKDITYSGMKPKRTYIGPRYNGGISDHLPTVLRVMGWRS
jgi:Predicted extracellular nuclease